MINGKSEFLIWDASFWKSREFAYLCLEDKGVVSPSASPCSVAYRRWVSHSPKRLPSLPARRMRILPFFRFRTSARNLDLNPLKSCETVYRTFKPPIEITALDIIFVFSFSCQRQSKCRIVRWNISSGTWRGTRFSASCVWFMIHDLARLDGP